MCGIADYKTHLHYACMGVSVPLTSWTRQYRGRSRCLQRVGNSETLEVIGGSPPASSRPLRGGGWLIEPGAVLATGDGWLKQMLADCRTAAQSRMKDGWLNMAETHYFAHLPSPKYDTLQCK